MKHLLRTVLAVGATGCVLLAASYWLPGMRPGDAVGANVSAGALFGIGALTAVAAIGLGIFGASTRAGERSRFVVAALGITVAALAVVFLGSAAYS